MRPAKEALSQAQPHDADHVAFADALAVWLKIGFLSFGGPAGQIALMHRVLVEERKWLSEAQFLHALNFCMLLPGPEAMQLATYAGWLLHGWRGGVVAGLLFVLPGAIVVLVLSMIYAVYGTTTIVAALFLGVKAAVLAIVIEALIRIARKALKQSTDWMIAAAAFIAILCLAVPFPLIILTAAIIGFLRNPSAATAGIGTTPQAAPRSARRTALTAMLWLAIWLVPLGGLTLVLGPAHVFSKVGWFFSTLAVVTFGGAYAVLAYMAQQAVEIHGWLAPGQMLDGLGLAETTPGPLILVTEFVGFRAGFKESGGTSLAYASLAAAIALWATFAPCFLWIFVGAPYVEQLRGQPRLTGALTAITAAVVGVIASLAVWFGIHTLFSTVTEYWAGPIRLFLPDPKTLDFTVLMIFVVSAAAIFRLKFGIIRTLSICGALGVVAGMV